MHENINVVTFEAGQTGLEESYARLLAGMKEVSGFRIVDQHEQTINGMLFKVLVERHSSRINGHRLEDYGLLTNQNGTAYLVTMTARFDR